MISRSINKKVILGISLMIALAGYISAFHYQLMLLQGRSMEPAYHNGQILLLDKHSQDFGYGDVIAIKKQGISGYLVKRIVAVPGDTVCIRDGLLYVNDQHQNRGLPTIDFAGIANEPISLGINEYFVLGDNIKDSIDSRYVKIGLVDRKEIKGKVIK